MEKQYVKLKKELINQSKHSINVLGNKIYVGDTGTILRIGHSTKIMQCNELFLLLEKKAKEFMVLVTKNLLNGLDGEEKYFYADKIAINTMVKKYPKDKLYWIFCFKIIIGIDDNSISKLNVNRIKKIISLLKLNKNKTAIGYLKEYESSYKFHNQAQKTNGDFLSDDDLMDCATSMKKYKTKSAPYKTGGIKIQNKWKKKSKLKTK